MTQIWQKIIESQQTDSTINSTTFEYLSRQPLVFTPLSNTAVVTLTGEQSTQYLQGQLTADIENLENDHWQVAAHCDAKGKAWAIYHVLKFTQDNVMLLSLMSGLNIALPELKKFSVFSQTEIAHAEQLAVLSVSGAEAASWLSSQQLASADTSQAHQIYQHNDVVCYRIAEAHFVLVANSNAMTALLENAPSHTWATENYHLWMQIQRGTPWLTEETSNQFVPQMLNLQALDAISFSKGCYIGQETVARMRYLGKNKRATYIVSGTSSHVPQPGDSLQRALGDNWRGSGTCLLAVTDSSIESKEKRIWLLAVMPNDLKADTLLRLENDEASSLQISPLPYSLNEEDE